MIEDTLERNLRNMKKFASEYPTFPIWQVPLAKLELLPIRKAAPCRIAMR